MKILSYENTEEIEKLLNKNHLLYEKEMLLTVMDIMEDIRDNSYDAIREYTKKFDGIDLEEKDFRVSAEEIKEAYTKVDEKFIESIKIAIKNIESFHELQKSEIKETEVLDEGQGIYLKQRVLPLERVGLYVPGGTAAYPSSVLMSGVIGKVAGVKDLVIVSPPNQDGVMNPYTLVAADLCNIREIYKVGGAQGIGFLTYGTKNIKKVDKIVGPGNIYVTLGKKLAYGDVDIDMIAGPSEILIIGDESANPKFVSADLLSQGEHDKLSSSIFVTTSLDLAKEVSKQVDLDLDNLERSDIARAAISNKGAIVVVASLDEAVEFANKFAPEHLELSIANPLDYVDKIINAGAVFMGHYTPEPIGDYIGGPSHVLPTCGTARFFSPLNVETFLKRSSVLSYSKEALNKYGKYVEEISNKEGLIGHGNAIRIRY